jgi:seryl-tRNA synthetase
MYSNPLFWWSPEMIDLNLLRENSDKIRHLILLKEPSFDVERLIALDQEVRQVRMAVENIRKEKNELASSGPLAATPEVRSKSIELGKQLKVKEVELEEIEKSLNKLWLSCPNIPQEDLPEGGKEANKAVKTYGQKPEFSFAIKNHVELNEKNNWFDMQAAANMSGAQFVLYRGLGSKVIYALTRLMLQNNVKYGFEPIVPPALVLEKALYNSGNLPKFEGDFYQITDDGLCLIPTAEVSLTNLYAGKILPIEQLPIHLTSWTSCFRREAGGYGSTERGLIRIHQFEKVELYSICEPEKSSDELDRMVACAENFLQMLGLHYQVSLLAMQDCSFCSARTYDIEVWLPGQNRYYEVSSCSNCTDFQARRAQIRYRKTADSKPVLAHTLNASSLALPRLMVALMECGQQPDGSIKLPDVLQKTMDELW